MSADSILLKRRWFPICGQHDLPANHVFETDLLGQELAVWRGRSGNVNVWENRCPHRGLRLSIGANLGGELRCAYHGYRFADESGLCTSVPAQPDRRPPQSLCAKIFPVLERGGLIWSRLTVDGPAVEPELSDVGSTLALYSVRVRSSAQVVADLLAEYEYRPSAALGDAATEGEYCSTSVIDAYRFRSVATKHGLQSETRLYSQPVDSHCTAIHGIVLGPVDEALRIPTLRHHAAHFTRIRAAAERLAQASHANGSETHGDLL